MMPRPGDRQLIREWNEGLVLDPIRRQGPIPRTEIADRTGLGRSTVTVITGRLLRQGLILESGSVASGDAGRRPVLLTLQSRSRAVVGALAESDRRVLEQAGADLGPAIGAGPVMPGVIDAGSGRSINPYYPSWAEMPFRHRLEELIEIPVLTDNDANAMALAEARPASAGPGRRLPPVPAIWPTPSGPTLVLQGR